MYALSTRGYTGESQLHRHSHHQFVLRQRGLLTIEIDGNGGVIDQSYGAFIAAGGRHQFSADGSNQFIVLDIPFDAFECLPGSLRVQQRLRLAHFFPITPPVQCLIEYVQSLTATDIALIGRSWAALLMIALADDRSVRADPTETVLVDALHFMRTHMCQRIVINDIAEAAGVSKTTLHRIFRERLHVSPHSRLAQMRLERALLLLSGTPLSIAEIAFQTGYADQSALTRHLKAVKGTTPAAYRQATSAVTKHTSN